MQIYYTFFWRGEQFCTYKSLRTRVRRFDEAQVKLSSVGGGDDDGDDGGSLRTFAVQTLARPVDLPRCSRSLCERDRRQALC